ncbi:MAG: hypothetical protein RR101_14265 [Burkholderiaceae bacterium]
MKPIAIVVAVTALSVAIGSAVLAVLDQPVKAAYLAAGAAAATIVDLYRHRNQG